MVEQIVITMNGIEFPAALNDTATARAIAQVLPIESRASRWGGEIYFSVPVNAGIESGAREVVEAGELGYWPRGSALCIFFGPTPLSQGDEIRAASAVNIIGRVGGALDKLWDVPDGAEVTIRRLSEGA